MHEHLWSHTSPTFVGLALGALFMGAGIAYAIRVLGHHDSSEETLAPDPAKLAIEEARARLAAEVARADAPLRAALAPVLEGALADIDARVAALLAAEKHAGDRSETERLTVDLDRVREALARERDPHAKKLLEASLRDLESTLGVQRDLARNARLARLELDRLRTMLETLPARIRELAARQLVQGDAGGVESIANQLHEAMKSTSDVLDAVRN